MYAASKTLLLHINTVKSLISLARIYLHRRIQETCVICFKFDLLWKNCILDPSLIKLIDFICSINRNVNVAFRWQEKLIFFAESAIYFFPKNTKLALLVFYFNV